MTKTNLTEGANDDFFPLLHQVSEESVILNAAYQYLFYSSPSEGSVLSAARQAIHYTLCWWLSHSQCRTLPPQQLWGKGRLLLHHTWTVLTRSIRGCRSCQVELYPNLSPVQSQAWCPGQAMEQCHRCTFWTPRMHILACLQPVFVPVSCMDFGPIRQPFL